MGVDFDKGSGLIPVITQDCRTGEVLMLAYANQDALDETLATGRAVYYSRSRGKLWRKGEESGHYQIIRSVRVDCDGDTLLYLVEQQGPGACHTGHRSCFFTELTPDGEREISTPVFNPDEAYGKK